MRTVEGPEGRRYLLLKESGESSLVRDAETGERRHLANDAIDPVDGESQLATAARAVPEAARTLVTAVHDERALGLLVLLADRDELAVRDLLAETDLCESDLHGFLAELTVTGLVAETTVAGERGYELSDSGAAAVAQLRGE